MRKFISIGWEKQSKFFLKTNPTIAVLYECNVCTSIQVLDLDKCFCTNLWHFMLLNLLLIYRTVCTLVGVEITKSVMKYCSNNCFCSRMVVPLKKAKIALSSSSKTSNLRSIYWRIVKKLRSFVWNI